MSILEILGPIMIGPSSSHTAGACRMAKVSREIISQKFEKVDFYLHGSFAETYHGHGTDRALVAGVLGMDPDDSRLYKSFEIAKEQGIKYEFIPTDLGYVHPNTVRFVFHLKDGERSITGSSIGGGSIVITELDGVELNLRAERPSLIVRYSDKKGVIHQVTELLLHEQINIATMEVSRLSKVATMVVEMDSKISKETFDKIKSLKGVLFATSVQGVSDVI